MSLEEQVDKDFSVARRRARMRILRSLLSGVPKVATLLDFNDVRRTVGAVGGIPRGRRTVELSSIVGSAGRPDHFDPDFMPLGAASAERWKRVDRAFWLGMDLPPVVLNAIRGSYFVQDGHHRVSVARFHGAEWIDAEVTEFRSSRPIPAAVSARAAG